MASYYIRYPLEWRNEIESNFGSISNCAKQCRIGRRNLYRSFDSNGYISENMLNAICKKIDRAPICFTDLRMHDHFYNDDYKMTYKEYTVLMAALMKSQKIKMASGSKEKNDMLTPTLQLWAGLSDVEIAALPDSVKLKLSLQISKLIEETLTKNLPGWC